MGTVITYSNIRSVRPIASNLVDENRLKPYIEEAENVYLKSLIKPLFYKELADYVVLISAVVGEDETPAERNAEYDLLLQGGLYDDDSMECYGLNKALGYLTYSRFVKNQNVNATAFGMVQKLTQNSEPLDEKTIFRIAGDAEKMGLEYLRTCIEYMKFIGKIQTCKKTITPRKTFVIGR